MYPPPKSVDVKLDDPISFAIPSPPDTAADPWPEADSGISGDFIIHSYVNSNVKYHENHLN